ncbi:DUF2078 family protein [Natrialba magadii ATCC 43099]|uniref:DUF2078 family protein n=1 Tax=Natrialba magadii (strain ATCC 43099 / DSM 3394 / CCM 3739 / CIP 104546 / IAM 13178 / JCM 8861 / NBRC 102185 / NCIMB 2190 / MS3) TaxID=547559 RepID=D3SXE3_NATMM|nr:hypothetical protein [Natrialba magadii]ADD05892.1 DUF2078 family protein [Natrialba magadii ATCC 43099]ELY30600.1 hypothetical protein C500_08772 [Natrialba magadii ATCC 43099]
MDNGTAAALLALVLGFPLVVVAAFTAGIPSSLAVFGLLGSLALAFVVAGQVADDNTQPAAASTAADTLDTTASEATDASSDTELELESLREQYARGELTERELDHELERVFEPTPPRLLVPAGVTGLTRQSQTDNQRRHSLATTTTR